MDRKFLRYTVVLPSIIIVFCLSLFGLWYSSLDYEEAHTEYQSLKKYVEVSFKDSQIEEELATTDIYDFQIDWDSLKQVNPDIVGWVIIPGTVVNYPIVQGIDNTEYLDRSFNSAENACGAIFMDSRCDRDFGNMNTVIYGHNMRDKSMFSCLNDYVTDEEFFREHDTVWVLTEKFQRKYRVFSAHYTQDGSESYSFHFQEGVYQRHIVRELDASAWDGGMYDVNMPMITLSTCAGGSDRKKRSIVLAQPVYEHVVDLEEINE